MSANVRHSSETNEHYTPREYPDAAREVMGAIDLDPASSEQANALIRSTDYFTAVDNGFVRHWHGRVWLNPPGGKCDSEGVSVTSELLANGKKKWSCAGKDQPACGHTHVGIQSSQRAWWSKLTKEWESGRVLCAVFLSFSMEIFQTAQSGVLPFPQQFPICYPKTRIPFHRADLTVGASPPHASALIFLPGDPLDVDRFADVFSRFGHCTRYLDRPVIGKAGST